jgi:hypothetical protein
MKHVFPENLTGFFCCELGDSKVSEVDETKPPTPASRSPRSRPTASASPPSPSPASASAQLRDDLSDIVPIQQTRKEAKGSAWLCKFVGYFFIFFFHLNFLKLPPSALEGFDLTFHYLPNLTRPHLMGNNKFLCKLFLFKTYPLYPGWIRSHDP